MDDFKKSIRLRLDKIAKLAISFDPQTNADDLEYAEKLMEKLDSERAEILNAMEARRSESYTMPCLKKQIMREYAAYIAQTTSLEKEDIFDKALEIMIVKSCHDYFEKPLYGNWLNKDELAVIMNQENALDFIAVPHNAVEVKNLMIGFEDAIRDGLDMWFHPEDGYKPTILESIHFTQKIAYEYAEYVSAFFRQSKEQMIARCSEAAYMSRTYALLMNTDTRKLNLKDLLQKENALNATLAIGCDVPRLPGKTWPQSIRDKVAGTLPSPARTTHNRTRHTR